MSRPMEVEAHTFDKNDDGKPYGIVNIRSAHHRVQVSVSPTGRSVEVYLDDERMSAAIEYQEL